MEILGMLTYVILCIGTGVMASGKNRSGFGWFIFSVVLSPVLGLIIVLCLRRKKDQSQQQVVIISPIMSAPVETEPD